MIRCISFDNLIEAISYLFLIHQVCKISVAFAIISTESDRTVKRETSDENHANGNIKKFNIKWLYDGCSIPIWFEHAYNASLNADYKWYKYSEKLYVNEIGAPILFLFIFCLFRLI